MSSLNIQWQRGKPFGVLAMLTGFAMLTQIPMIYHAMKILQVTNSKYLPAYIIIIIAAVFIISTAEVALYEAFLIRLRSYTIKDYRAPFIAATIVSVVYFACYFATYAILVSVSLFDIQDPVAKYGFCQMIGLLLIMIIAFWYNKRQTKVLESL
jgi:membrane protease YdiL (CAAX protease family)